MPELKHSSYQNADTVGLCWVETKEIGVPIDDVKLISEIKPNSFGPRARGHRELGNERERALGSGPLTNLYHRRERSVECPAEAGLRHQRWQKEKLRVSGAVR